MPTPPLLRSAFAGAITAAVAWTAPAFAEGSSGTTRDSVTGWHCLTPFCDTLLVPGTGCLCQKQNPGETRLSRLRFTCIPPSGSQQGCPLPRGIGGG